MTQESAARRSGEVETAFPAPAPCPSVQVAEDDPVLVHYRAYLAARDEWARLAVLPGNEDFDDPRSIAAQDRKLAAYRAMGDHVPASMAGIAAMAHVLWIEEAAMFLPGSPGHADDVADPGNRLIAAIWRAAAGAGGDEYPPGNDF